MKAVDRQPRVASTASGDLRDPRFYLNRELSQLDVSSRLLDLAEDAGVPLLERLKFVAIVAEQLDELFMVRVARLDDRLEAGVHVPDLDGRGPEETLEAIWRATPQLLDRQHRVLREQVLPALADHGIRLVGHHELPRGDRERIRERFRRQILPVLTPLAVAPARPFPYISHGSLSIGATIRDPGDGAEVFARVKVPTEVVPRFVSAGDRTTFVALEDVIRANLAELFPAMSVVESACFRVTRATDLTVEPDADDLVAAIEVGLRRRRFHQVVRLEVASDMPETMREHIAAALDGPRRSVVDGLIDLSDLREIVRVPGHAGLRDPPWVPLDHPRLGTGRGGRSDVMAAMRERDVLVHHPYDSFSGSVERLVEQATVDRDVLAIKLTVYRTSDDTPLVPALVRAAESGKQALCVVELKARDDETAYIARARALEDAGVQVVYGPAHLKTHAKCLLIVRREGDGVRRYVHVGTGNYHPKTARTYTDFGLLTCDDAIGEDVEALFDALTGGGLARARFDRVVVAPDGAREAILAEIAATADARLNGDDSARIAMKMNALVDRECIHALYRASQARVPVELNVRDICCLRPGIDGVSDTIRVFSIKGRFHEHARVYAFRRQGGWRYLIGSADLRPRNLDRRIEVLVPVDDAEARQQLQDALDRAAADDSFAWDLGSDGGWTRRGRRGRCMHEELMALAVARSRHRGPAR